MELKSSFAKWLEMVESKYSKESEEYIMLCKEVKSDMEKSKIKVEDKIVATKAVKRPATKRVMKTTPIKVPKAVPTETKRRYKKRTTGTVEVKETEPVLIKGVTDKEYITLNDFFKVPTGLYNILKRNILAGTNTMLLGPTGVGKTELASYIAKEMKLPLTIFDMGTMTDPIMSLVGSHVITVRDGNTTSEFKKSRFSEAIQKPGIILLDELPRANVTANNLLFPVLDFRRELAMEYCFEDNTPIKVHPECVFIATANIGSQYTGSHKLDRALIDRFMLLEVDPLSQDQIKESLSFLYPSVGLTKINRMVSCFIAINKAHDDFTVSFNLSLRHLKNIVELVRDGFTIYDSFYVVCKGIGSKEGLKTIESILNPYKTKE